MDKDPTVHAASGNAERNAALVSGIVRASGAVFMLLGTALGFNVGGIAEFIGISDSLTGGMAGGAVFMVGLIDFLVMPQMLASKISRQ